MDLLETVEPRSVCSPSRVFLGFFIIFVATAILSDRLDWAGFHVSLPAWPWIVVILGLVRLGQSRANGQIAPNRSAVALLLLGAWGLVNEYRIFDVSYRRTWPILLIVAGVVMVLRSQDSV